MTDLQAAGAGAAGDGAAGGGGSGGTGGSTDSAVGDDAAGFAERGETSIADRVVAKVAAQAAREALRSGPDADRMPRGNKHAPHAGVTVHDRTARVRVTVELGYPSDIGAQCAAVRRQVALRVRELVGMEVPDVAVGVERLHSEEQGGETSWRVR